MLKDDPKHFEKKVLVCGLGRHKFLSCLSFNLVLLYQAMQKSASFENAK